MSRRTLYIIITLIFSLNSAIAANPDSLKTASFSTFELLPLMNPWLNTSNPAGLHLNEGPLPGRISLFYGSEEGDYKRVQQGKQFNGLGLQSQSYAKIHDINLFGNFRYEKSHERGLDYSNTNNPYRGTPYDMIDTIGNDNYNREFFYLNGALSKPFGTSTVMGIAFDYAVGVAVQDRDPRPQNKVLDMALRPGIMQTMNNVKLGLNLVYEYYNEEIDIDIVKDNAYMSIFRLLGPGVTFYHEAKSFNRLYKRNSGGFDAQLNYSDSKYHAMLGSKFLYFMETAQDGGKGGDASWNFMRDISDLKGMDWKVYANLRISKGKQYHFIDAGMNFLTSLGIEKLEKLEQVGILDAQDWVFFMDDPKYGSESVNASLSYRFMQMKNPLQQNFSITISGNYNSFEQTYHIPSQLENYQNALFSMKGTKIFSLRETQLTLGAAITYKMNTGGEQDFEAVNFINDKLLRPDFLYLTSNYYAPAADLAFEVPFKNIFNKFFLRARVELFKGDNSQSRTIASFSSGLIF